MFKIFMFLSLVSMLFAGNIDLFPKPNDSQIKQVLHLKPLKDEGKKLVIINFAKKLKLDCNYYFFTDESLETKSLKGYGYPYYELNGGQSLAGTKKLCQEKPIFKLVEFRKNIVSPYTSKLPFVIYTPKDVVVIYKIYTLTKEAILKK